MNETKWTELHGDGGTKVMPADRFNALREEWKQLCTDAGASVNDRRQLADDVRFNRWEGQSRDGKKHADAQGGKPAFPFEGASDARIRTADGIINEQVIIIMAAVMRMRLSFKGTERNDDEFAANLSTLWDWVLRNQLAREWFVELTKVAQWRQGDSPAVGLLQVCWHQEKTLEAQSFTVDTFMADAATKAKAQGVQIGEQEVAYVMGLLQDPGRIDELAQLVQTLWPEMPASRATKVAADLQDGGETTFPYPRVTENRLRVKARRLLEDIYVPENTADLQRARVIFVREWFTETELREMDAAGEFEPGFLTEILKHEGESGWKHFCHTTVEGDYSAAPQQRAWDKNAHRGQYELLTAFFRASNDAGIPAIYTVQWSELVAKPATKQELFDYQTGKYPFVDFRREIVSDKIWDTRGISELAMTEQTSLKLLHDSFMDHAQLCTVPPVEVPMSRPKMALVFGPLKQIRTNRPGEIKFMTMAQYPVSNDKVRADIEKEIDRYFGRMSANNTPDWVRLYQQWLVDFFLLDLVEVVKMGLQLCQQFMDDATIARVLGVPGVAIGRTGADIKAQFDCEVSFEAGMLALDYLKEIGAIISQFVLPWDTLNTVRRDELVSWFMSGLSPTLARRLVQPVQAANQTEVDDEENNFTKITAGIEPPMLEAGQNFQLRLQTLLGIGQKNPEAFARLAPKSREILEARMKHFDGMIQQQKNAQIGRTMAAPALQQN